MRWESYRLIKPSVMSPVTVHKQQRNPTYNTYQRRMQHHMDRNVSSWWLGFKQLFDVFRWTSTSNLCDTICNSGRTLNQHRRRLFKMTVFHDEVEIEDFEYDEETETYYFPCPCGDRFAITKASLFC